MMTETNFPHSPVFLVPNSNSCKICNLYWKKSSPYQGNTVCKSPGNHFPGSQWCTLLPPPFPIVHVLNLRETSIVLKPKHRPILSYLLRPRFNDLLLRCRELDTWTQDLALPAVVWLSGLFNPQSFLTGKACCSQNRCPGRKPAPRSLPRPAPGPMRGPRQKRGRNDRGMALRAEQQHQREGSPGTAK